MPGNLLSSAATIQCPHGGRAFSVGAASATHMDGTPVHTAADVFAISGCPHIVGGVPQPCTTIRFGQDASGVLADGAPVLLDTSAGQCFSAGLIPQGSPTLSVTRPGVVCR